MESLWKNTALSDLRDELKEQKDEGLMAYVRENIPIDVTLLGTVVKLDAKMAHYRY